jgi:glycosyltransferase involved in cell wall biosynthesis
MRQRILVAADFYPPFLGGLERQAQLLARELAGRGHEVTVATVWHRGLPEQEDDGGVTVHRVKGLTTGVPWFSTVPGRRYHPPFPDPAVVWHLRRLIRRMQPDVVHARGWIAYSCAAALWGTKIPLLISAHDYGYSCAVRTLVRQGRSCDGPALRKCLACATRAQGVPKGVAAVLGVLFGRGLLRRRVAAAHSVSTFVQQFTQRHLLDGAPDGRGPRSVLIPDIGASSHLDAPRVVAGAPRGADSVPKQPYILYVGGLTKAKGLAPLLSAYQRLPNPPPLLMIGTVWPDTPPQFPAGVTVIQNLPNPKVLLAWQHCLFGVVPSLWAEPLPNVILEAMTHGRAVIATRVGGVTDLVLDGRTGILVPPGDVTALARAMQRLVADHHLRQSLGQAGLARAQMFAASAIVPRFEALYRQLEERHTQVPREVPAPSSRH